MRNLIRGFLFVFGLVAVLTATSPTFAAPPDIRERLKTLGGTPCPNSAFTCITLTVPLDHFNPSDTRTIDVVFAVLPATGVRKGMFVTVMGGPGVPGIYYADDYTSYFDPAIPETFDIVFFDQRGIGQSGGMDCYAAASKFYLADWRADTTKREKKLRQAAETFADECDAEMGHPEILPYLSTEQAVRDLDLFRDLIGDEKFWLYGESYGTQYTQQYGNAFPEHLAGMILDGTVDLTPDGISYYANAGQAFNDALVASLQQCQDNPLCRADFGMKPLRAYDQLAKLLQSGAINVAFPMPDGARVNRKFGFDDLDTTGEGQMYGEGGRMLLVRALAAYARDGDLVPLTRLLYPNLGIDEVTLQPSYDPSWSDAYYYGVECQDYGYFTGTEEERADLYVAQAKPYELSGVRLNGLIWGDLPCVYWRDSSQNTTRSPFWSFDGIPTLVLNAIADPITPINGARAVYEHLDDGYLITQNGGPHVIFGRGKSCVDDPVTAFLVSDTMPAQRETACPGKTMSTYFPLAPADSRDFPTLFELFASVETEINYLPEYWYWDYETTTRTGCPLSGWIEFRAVENRAEFTLENCAFSEGFVMTGDGKYQFGKDRFVLDVSATGYQDCDYLYKRASDGVTLDWVCGNTVGNSKGAADPTLFERENPREAQRPTRAR